MPHLPGLDLAGRLYREAVRPLLDRHRLPCAPRLVPVLTAVLARHRVA